MVVVRESPHSKTSPDKNTTQWPPRSPFQALLSSPSGRKKWQDRRNNADGDRSVSPSPVKRKMNREQDMSVNSDDGDEEDEETLQLQLQAIQTKLKLKKLQKKSEDGGSGSRDNSIRDSSRASARSSSPLKSAFISQPRSPKATVEVPLSPTKDRNPPKEPVSPARARLGLDGSVRARDISLKRARDGTQLRHSAPRRALEAAFDSPKATSFSERLARSKVESEESREKQERLDRLRSKGFGDTGTATTLSQNEARRPSSAHQMQNHKRLDGETTFAKSASTRTSRSSRPDIPRANGLFQSRPPPSSKPSGDDRGQTSDDSDNDTNDKEEKTESSPGFDAFSQVHLSKRHIPHVDIARAMADKDVYTLPRLLKEVKAPHYDPPDCESDFVVFAVLASKSNPFDQKAAHRTTDENKPQEDSEKPRNKFMVFHLCDLKWEVDCFLFGSAFDQFWKLTPGTLLAILNPAIMPPKTNQHSGRFSLKLGSSEDCVMEIGVARDLGYCVSTKKDGQQCGSWIDKRKTELCDFHLEMLVERERKGRMEVNTMWRNKDGGGKSEWKPKSHSGGKGAFDGTMNGRKNNGNYHREYGQLYSVPGGYSTANLLDAEDKLGIEDEEKSRKRIAAAQRERDLAKKLGEMGNGVGAEYLRNSKHVQSTTTSSRTHSALSSTDPKTMFEKPSASELGLLANKATDQHLSPAKDRKRHFGLGAASSTNGGAEALGWGGAKKAGLLQPKESRLGSPEKGQVKLTGIVRNRSEDDGGGGTLSSPSKKRARFALEKGIREPGRESLGADLREVRDGVGEDEDDELDIV